MLVLHLEDSPVDAKLVQAALRAAGFQWDIRRVDSREGFINGLREIKPELILADYQLPSFDGCQALDIARKQCPEIPFIFVTGALGEELAIETLKRGATDYVLKQSISRLGPAVKRALAESQERRERKRAEEEVARLNRDLSARVDELQTLFRVAPIGIAVARDLQCSHIDVNPSGAAMLGISEGDNASKSGPGAQSLGFRVHSGGAEVPADQLPMQIAARTGEQVVGRELEIVRTDGSKITLLQYAAPLRDENGQTRGAVGVWADISNYKRAEAALKAAREEAERLSRIKDEFLATLSHELRTPLTPILGWTRMIRNAKLNGPQTEHAAEIIERNVMSQLALIEDLLDISRIIAGKLKIEVLPTNLAPVIEAAIDAVRPMADAKEIKLSVSGEPVTANGDAARLQQIVWNLLTNAVKFSPKGSKVEIRTESAGASARIIVSDNGEGIPVGYLPYIFDRFTQADSTTTRRHGGLGLGLSIVKHLVELHGGSIAAESQGSGTGSRFTVTLPTAAGAASPGNRAARADAPMLTGLRVLVVDDEVDTREMVHFVLADSGAEVVDAVSVSDALDKFERFKPSIVIADISMPDEDGYVLMRKLRAKGVTTPVIALTAYARVEDRKRILSEGFQHHLAKPIDPAELATTVASFANTNR